MFIYNQPRFDAVNTLRTLVKHGVTTLCAPPTAWRTLILEDLKWQRERVGYSAIHDKSSKL